MLVRLYPYAPRQGFVLKRYTLVNEGLRFLGERGWYEVTEEIAEVLRDIPQQSRHPHGPKAFAIARDSADAKRLDAKIDEILRQAKGEDDRVGTADAPVPATPMKKATRPGTRQASAGDEEPAKPRTRKRKTEDD